MTSTDHRTFFIYLSMRDFNIQIQYNLATTFEMRVVWQISKPGVVLKAVPVPSGQPNPAELYYKNV